MNIKSILTSALLLTSFMTAGAQTRYLNVQTGDGQYKSFEVTPKLELSWDLENYEEKKLAFGKGTAKAMIDNVATDVNWVQLWEGGPMFADHNIGAISETDYGGYYCWGGSYRNGTGIDWNSDYNTTKSFNVDNGILVGDEDTATKLWGENWRMPTNQEFITLINSIGNTDYCTRTWTTDYKGTGVNGWLITGKGDYSNNSIFLPAAGLCVSNGVQQNNSFGYYWSSYTSHMAYDKVATCMEFNSGEYPSVGDDYSRDCAYSVRAVYAPKPATTTGTAKAMIDNVETDVNWVQLWEGGPMFADHNIGATSETDCGGYYCWGKSIDKDPYWAYNEEGEVLSGDDDTATKLWGSNWRMPTRADFGDLLNNCTCTWETDYNGTDVNGLLCIGKGGYSSNRIFFPAAGFYSEGGVWMQNEVGYYWSSTPQEENRSFMLDFSAEGKANNAAVSRRAGHPVRAVLAK